MRNRVEASLFLIIGVDDVPRSFLAVSVLEHDVLCLRIVDPTLARFHVHRAQLPTLNWIFDALLKPPLLLFVVHREPILDEIDARAHQHLLKYWAGTKEL